MHKVAQHLALVLAVGGFLSCVGGNDMNHTVEFIFLGVITLLLFLSFRPLKMIEDEQQKKQAKEELRNKKYRDYLIDLNDYFFLKEIDIILDMKDQREKKRHLDLYKQVTTERNTMKKTQT